METPPKIRCNISSLINPLYKMVFMDDAYPTPRKDYRAMNEHSLRTDETRRKIRRLIDLARPLDSIQGREVESIWDIHNTIGVWSVEEWDDIRSFDFIGMEQIWGSTFREGYVVVSLSAEGVRYLNSVARWVSSLTGVTV